MTPFDAAACLAMLLAFYPVPSPAALQQARSERPEYFSGATLIGHSGDKFQLPDGRIFDCIFAVDGPVAQRRWQMLEPGPSGPPDLWALEPGPLTPIPIPDVRPRVEATTFQTLVADALDALGASDGVLAASAQTVIAAREAVGGTAATAGALNDLADVVAQLDGIRDDNDLVDVVAQSDGLTGAIDSTDAEYDEAPPQPALPSDPDIPGYPGEDGTSGEPGRENPRHPEHEHEPAPGDGG